MRLGQIKWRNQITAAVFENGAARPIPSHSVRDLIRRSEVEGIPLVELAAQHASPHAEPLSPILPVHPYEVWACERTYGTDAPDGARPEIFFKGNRRVCVGPGEPIGIRADSTWTAPEPELALLLGAGGRILGYTLANDVSARDIERENPLYRPQAKFYAACCALGPVIVTADEMTDARHLEMSCEIRRGEQVLFAGSVSTARLHQTLETLVEYVLRSNPVPGCSVLLTGTGIFTPQEAALAPGDVVSIRVAEIGELSNPAAIV